MVKTTERENMKENLKKSDLLLLSKSKLFSQIGISELTSVLSCLDTRTASYKKGETILLVGNPIKAVGIVLSGSLQIVKEDIDGSRVIMAAIGAPEMFGEAICCAGLSISPVSVIADTDSSVMFLNFPRILRVCSNACSFHAKLIENMLQILAQKNLFLQNRMDIISSKSIRDRVLKYLASFPSDRGKPIEIPLNREKMAEYLCTDRSALSHELMRMKRDGVISYERNRFLILNS